jgi:hypothetical protein
MLSVMLFSISCRTQPGKEDYQAFRAVCSAIDEISECDFPHVIGWYNSLKASSADRLRKAV